MKTSAILCITCILLVAPVRMASSAEALAPESIVVGSRDELVRAVTNSRPGDIIQIAPGEYAGGLSFRNVRGAAGRPIILTAQNKARPPVFKGGTSGFHFVNPSHLQLRHLKLIAAKANGLNVDDGGSSNNSAVQIELHHLQIRDIANTGNRDGIKLSGVNHFVVSNCVIERWGDKGSAIDMVGCHHGRVQGCTFRHRVGVGGSGVQTKGGSANIQVSRCRFENAGERAVNIGGSTGLPYFRPRNAGYEAREITVEDCTFIGSMAPISFVGVDGAKVRYNTIYRPTRWVVRILQETTGERFAPCRNGEFTNNLIAFRRDELRTAVNVGANVAASTFTFAKNHWYCLNSPSQSGRLNLPVREQNGSYGADPAFIDENKRDLRLAPNSPVRDAGVRPEKSDK